MKALSLPLFVFVFGFGRMPARRIGSLKHGIHICRRADAACWLVVLHGVVLAAIGGDWDNAERIARWLDAGCLAGRWVHNMPVLDARSLTYLGQRPELLKAYWEVVAPAVAIAAVPA